MWGKLKLLGTSLCLILLAAACPSQSHLGIIEKTDSGTSSAPPSGNSGRVDFPGDESGARQLISQFLQAGMDKEALTKKLRPRLEDYSAVFKSEVAKQVEENYREPWDQGKIVIHGQPGETEILIGSATTEDFKKQNEAGTSFPIGYSKVAPYLNDGLRIYRFKFVRPGEKLGFAWDGLIFINGHWAFFPMPWRVIPGLVLTVPAPEGQ